MKRMSRWLAILMAAIMMLGCFQMASAEGAQLEEVDLIYWVGANPDQKDEAMVMAELQKIAKEALNVNIANSRRSSTRRWLLRSAST